MTAKELRVLKRISDRRPHVVVFTKADGSERTMRLEYRGGIARDGKVKVWDLEHEGFRVLTLSTVRTISHKSTDQEYADGLREAYADYGIHF